MTLTRRRVLEALLCTIACANFAVAYPVSPWVTKNTASISPQRQLISMASTEENCGCGELVRYSGDPPPEVKLDFDIRESLRNKNIYDIKGNSVTIDEILGNPDRPLKKTAIAVFFRSLG